ncbi:hypothetical protein OPV22_024560 [Ensete ventricosum]|uniref:DUF6821 domain-containing protein n=1 Tax=Ensete ventricosum TaxID=4639 RepID=A0AAV8QD91_ENSVE|nr:hypothetical protein OPV22_024560 [Ensete ventricosum]
MQKTYLEMDLEEWEFLPDNKRFPDSGHGGKKDVLLKEIIVDMNYFICPSRPITSKEGLLPVISVGKSSDDAAAGREFKDIGVVAPVIQANQPDVVSQVFFKKLKDNEFVDMKMDSPKSSTRGAIMPHAEPEHVQLRENEEEEMETEKEKDRTGPEIKAAAATICIFILGGRQQQQRNHKIQFKIYTDDKRMKEVVQQTTRLKQALSAARAAPMTRAHITFGGCYTSV